MSAGTPEGILGIFSGTLRRIPEEISLAIPGGAYSGILFEISSGVLV